MEEELKEIKRLTKDIIKLTKDISQEHVRPLQEKIDNLSIVADTALQKWTDANAEMEKLKFRINKAAETLKE